MQTSIATVSLSGGLAEKLYGGLLSLEIFNDQFRAGSPRGVAIDGQRSLVYLMDQMRGTGGALGKAAPQIHHVRSTSASSFSNSRRTTVRRADRGRQPAHRAQCLAEPADAVVAFF